MIGGEWIGQEGEGGEGFGEQVGRFFGAGETRRALTRVTLTHEDAGDIEPGDELLQPVQQAGDDTIGDGGEGIESGDEWIDDEQSGVGTGYFAGEGVEIGGIEAEGMGGGFIWGLL